MELGEELKKKEFLLSPKSVFLNNGSYGAVARRVMDHQHKLREEMERHPDTWYRRTNPRKQRESLTSLAKFLGGDPKNMVFVENVTSGIQSVLGSLNLRYPDVVLCSNMTYHAARVLLKSLSSGPQGVTVAEVKISFPIKSPQQIVRTYREFLEKYNNNNKVKVCIIDHITSPSCVLMPLKELCDLCRTHGILVLVDGAHACGQLPLQLEYLGADFYTGNVHKWLFTPRGCAYLWIHPRHQRLVRPAVVSHFNGFNLHYDFCIRGTRDDTPYHCVGEAVSFFEDLGGWDAVTSHNKKLLEAALKRLENAWGTTRLDVADDVRAPFMALIRVPDLEQYAPNSIGGGELETDLFNHYDITILCTPVDGALHFRLSVHVYNSMADIEKLEKAVLELKAKGGERSKQQKGYVLPIMHWDLSPLKFE